MYQDEIIKEVWRNRETLARQSDHDLHAFVLDIQKRQTKPLSEVVDRRRRTREPLMCREDPQPPRA